MLLRIVERYFPGTMLRLLGMLATSFALSIVGHAQDIEAGESVSAVVTAKGQPLSKATAGKRAIYRWNDMTVTFEDGLVIKIDQRDRSQEQVLQKREDAAIAAQKAQEEQARQKAEARMASFQATNQMRGEQDRSTVVQHLEVQRLEDRVRKLEAEKAKNQKELLDQQQRQQAIQRATDQAKAQHAANEVQKAREHQQQQRQVALDLINAQIRGLEVDIQNLQRASSSAYMARNDSSRNNYNEQLRAKQQQIQLLKQQKDQVFFGR